MSRSRTGGSTGGWPATRQRDHVLTAGVSIALSGPLARQGREAAAGLELWTAWAGVPLTVLDDGSRAARARDNIARLLDVERVGLLFGPYGSGLTLTVAGVAAARGAVLWNHGGASDAVAEQGPGAVVTLPSPASDYLRRLPALARRWKPAARRVVVLHARAGTFAAAVARGVDEGARAAGFTDVTCLAFDSPLGAAGVGLDAWPDVLVGVGRFDDDVALARVTGRGRPGLLRAFVAAGLDAFGREARETAEGVIGPSQWEPAAGAAPALGPDAPWFSREFQARTGAPPGYPAAQAFAAGVVAAECARRAGTLGPAALLAAARDLDTTTLYGAFRLDRATGRQVGHRPWLVQWRAGRRVAVEVPPGVP
jgi:branched-chain amino acid transport system substrate-binding protein